jgi:hypothetical protein
VVGEAHYQETLRKIEAAHNVYGMPFVLTVWLYPEPTNPHDDHAVVVAHESERIGYLRREDARLCFDHLRQHRPVSCQAEVRGYETLGVFLLAPPVLP